MSAYSLSHLSDHTLLRDLASLVARDRATTARLLAHLAEVDTRRLYLPAAHPSMFSYCVHELHLCEQAAFKRILAARTARRFPGIFTAVADGRLHLSAVVLLAPHLTEDTAAELLAAAEHKTKSELEQLLAARFPRPDLPTRIEALGAPHPPAPFPQLSPGIVDPSAPGPVDAAGPERLGALAGPLAPAQVGPRSKLVPVAPERFLLQVTIARSTQDKLRYVQQLLGHAVPSGDLAQVLDRALEALIEQLEKRKFAATPKPRRSERPSADPRHILAHVRRVVWERDSGQCTFVSETGRRCPARKRLEFDHAVEVARGGKPTVAGIQLRCRSHNQFGAECTFGADFMRHKREQARRSAEARRRETAERAADEARRKAADETRRQAAADETQRQATAWAAAEEVIAPLRQLGFRPEEARRAAALCASIPDASLEQHVRRALSYFHPRSRTVAPAATGLESAP